MVDGNVVEAQIVEGGVFLRVFLPLRPIFQPREDVKLSDEDARSLTSDNALAVEYNQRVVKSVRLGALVWPDVK